MMVYGMSLFHVPGVRMRRLCLSVAIWVNISLLPDGITGEIKKLKRQFSMQNMKARVRVPTPKRVSLIPIS